MRVTRAGQACLTVSLGITAPIDVPLHLDVDAVGDLDGDELFAELVTLPKHAAASDDLVADS